MLCTFCTSKNAVLLLFPYERQQKYREIGKLAVSGVQKVQHGTSNFLHVKANS